MKARDVEYVVFDVETTGLRPEAGDRIIEIAAARVRGGRITEFFVSLVHPRREIPEEVRRIHRIDDAMIAGAPPAADVLPQVLDFIGGSCLAGHNVKFDLDFLCHELSLIGRKLNDITPALDTVKFARHFLPQLSTYQLASLAQYFGVRIGETHRAEADVRLTVAILHHLFLVAETQGVRDFQEIIRLFGVAKPQFKLNGAAQTVLF